MIRVIRFSLLLLLFNTNVLAEDITNMVQKNVSLVVSLVKQNEELSVEDLQPKIDEVLVNLINFEAISRGVMGNYRKSATMEQQEAFQQNLRISLGSLFIRSFRAIGPKNIDIVEVKTSENKGRAKVQFTTSDNAMVELLFSLRKKDNIWLVVNFLVDGVNMGLAYRNVFDARMKEYGDLDLLISRWNADIDSG